MPRQLERGPYCHASCASQRLSGGLSIHDRIVDQLLRCRGKGRSLHKADHPRKAGTTDVRDGALPLIGRSPCSFPASLRATASATIGSLDRAAARSRFRRISDVRWRGGGRGGRRRKDLRWRQRDTRAKRYQAEVSGRGQLFLLDRVAEPMTAGVATGRDERADPEHEVERSIPGNLGLSHDVLGRRRDLPDRHRQCDVVRERVCDRWPSRRSRLAARPTSGNTAGSSRPLSPERRSVLAAAAAVAPVAVTTTTTCPMIAEAARCCPYRTTTAQARNVGGGSGRGLGVLHGSRERLGTLLRRRRIHPHDLPAVAVEVEEAA